MMKTITLAFLFSLAIVSCQKIETSVEQSNPDLIGTWVNPQYSETVVTYDKASNLVENQYGFIFKSDNTLIERKIDGWCGTPPVTTADYKGTWTTNDSIVTISVGYWGGTAKYKWKVITLNDHKLVVSILETKYLEGW